MEFSHPTPLFPHIKHQAYRDVYEPAEDSFLFMDALELETSFINQLKPAVCLELGSGSGAVLTFLAKLLCSPAFLWAVDINLAACKCTLDTLSVNSVQYPYDAVAMDLVPCFMEKLSGRVDVLLFNPPYVVTPSEEVGGSGIEASWAGGKDGREVTDSLLPCVPELLAPGGVFYLVATKENKPGDICNIFASHGFKSRTVLSRKASNEFLSILKFHRLTL